MIYTHDAVTHETRENEANIKKQLTALKSKTDTIEERFAVGEIDKEIYQKFKSKFNDEQNQLELNLIQPKISSSNLQKAINKAIKMASKLSEIWESGDLYQKKKIQQLKKSFAIEILGQSEYSTPIKIFENTPPDNNLEPRFNVSLRTAQNMSRIEKEKINLSLDDS